MHFRKKVMRGEISTLCLVLATLALGSVLGETQCERGQGWWDRERGECIPCTRCDTRSLAVRYPCEVHRDTICQPLHEVLIPSFNGLPEDDSDDYNEYIDFVDYSSDVTDDDEEEGEVKWDPLQTSSLVLAIGGCVVFFLVVLVLTLYHAKQWRIIKRVLRSDVRDLTAKLKLMESGAETQAEPVMPSDHHIYCNIHIKESLLDSTKKDFGNVYTQE